MVDTLSAIWANPVYRKLILSVIVLLASMVTRCLLDLLLVKRLSDGSLHVYVDRKVTGYAVNALSILVLTGIWLEHLGNLSVALGNLGVGLALALLEVIDSIGGWVTILAAPPSPGTAARSPRTAPQGMPPFRHQDHITGSPGFRKTYRQLDRVAPGLS